MRLVLRALAALPVILISPLLVLIPFLALGFCDLAWLLFGRRRRSVPAVFTKPQSASVVIPNWNGRDLLNKYLPPLIEAMKGHPDNEIIVVDNGSSDGSADLVRTQFPQVRLIPLTKNLGFGGGCNTGARAARNSVVILMNSDMRVDAGFLAPLLAGFTDDKVFAVSCQIFFSDASKLREETGLTQGWWESGRLKVRHRIEDAITEPYPCFYGGGGSCACDRDKFHELGGLDPLLGPFYLEDTDLGYMAWKRGWKVLYQPRSVVYHEHRSTIGKKFSETYIQTVLKKNFALFCWKNIHEWRRFLPYLAYAWADIAISAFFGDSPERTNARGTIRACRQVFQAMSSRWAARSLAEVSDTEAFRRPLGGYFRDRFQVAPEEPRRLSVLFLSPYPICPPTHGGGVFMYQTTSELARLCDLHLIVLLDRSQERDAHAELMAACASSEFMVRPTGRMTMAASITPHAVAEFSNHDLEWLIHRQILTKNVDVLQLEYMPMGQYGGEFRQIVSILFEHDIYFQSVGRQLANVRGLLPNLKARFEYLRSLRYELGLLPRFDRIQVCSRDNHQHLLTFLPELRSRIDDDLRAGVDTSRYSFQPDGREPETMLFVGGFRHIPNQEAVNWFARFVLPRILEARPAARLVLVGSDPPAVHSLPYLGRGIELRGFVEDVREPLSRYGVFVCPILSGSGMRVKLLEAFAAGIPVVSTRMGAEGLADVDGNVCALADNAAEFADRVIELLGNPEKARAMAVAARALVERERDMRALTRKLELGYRRAVKEKRGLISSQSSSYRPAVDPRSGLQGDSGRAP